MIFKRCLIDEPNETLPCADCGAPMCLRKNGLTGQVFFACGRAAMCGATHPANQDGTPDGEPADRDTRNARRTLHGLIVRIDGQIEAERGKAPKGSSFRGRAYNWLADALRDDGMRIDRLTMKVNRMDLATAERAIEICQQRLEEKNAAKK